MKLSIFLVAYQSGEAISCGDLYDGTETVEITSPGFPGPYPRSDGWEDITCIWAIENKCNLGYEIIPHHFDVAYHWGCRRDKLDIWTYDSTGENETSTFCNRDQNGNIAKNGPLDYTYIVESGDVYLRLTSDWRNKGLTNTGFRLEVRPIRDPFCNPFVTAQPGSCLASEKHPRIAYWETSDIFEKAVPYSEYDILTYEFFPADIISTGDDLRKECLDRCVDSAGCFKVKLNPESEESKCELRGHNLTPEEGLTFAINGKTCDTLPQQAWEDRAGVFTFSCLFSNIENVEQWLEYLISQNGAYTSWNTFLTEEGVVKSSKWTFGINKDKTSPDGTWYAFRANVYFRTFVTGFKSALEKDLYISLAEAATEEFIENLQIGDAEVLETTDPIIEVELLKEGIDPPKNAFGFVFNRMEEFMASAVENTKKNANKKMKMIKNRFSWFTDYSDSPCQQYAGDEPDAGIDYVPATLDVNDQCASVASFHPALVGYFENFVCLDRVDPKARNMRRTAVKLGLAKKFFNRVLKKMSCPQSV
ncbi:Oidioi.mRNA.OKI2018_I69.chr1.g3677.t1.cds [Oikopleura dioica]|uniref:Oidioi.mRNA.OKI2018_I69.chr1.g3677.t1.cds n=1 Tax=Oikopleura dioica TaxID=34765 RepID=A0ABN7SVH5_OIKDI|nr:Oidioi.mRNA.OKI2018_I69.chr1.g3677.t1.cds [Oikopleura dioica]